MGSTIIAISVAIPVKNEEANLARCLAQLKRFSEVIVIDSRSSDRTRDIAREFGALVLNFEWNGRYPKKRNWLLLNHELKNKWVLFLDADEFVDDEFCDEVAERIARTEHDGFWISYDNFFLGRRLNYGVPQRKLALFRVGHALYERIDEANWSQLDMEIHEHPIVQGSVGAIVSRIEHNDDRGIVKFIDRHRDYALWESERMLDVMNKTDAKDRIFTPRQKFKYRNIHKWWYPFSYFFYAYFIRGGFLDGAAGLQYALLKAWYFLFIRLIVAERRQDT